MPQLVTRISEELAEAVDELVAEGAVASRSEAVRSGLEQLVELRRRLRVGESIALGYRDTPQSDAELVGLDQAARRLIAEEPW